MVQGIKIDYNNLSSKLLPIVKNDAYTLLEKTIPIIDTIEHCNQSLLPSKLYYPLYGDLYMRYHCIEKANYSSWKLINMLFFSINSFDVTVDCVGDCVAELDKIYASKIENNSHLNAINKSITEIVTKSQIMHARIANCVSMEEVILLKNLMKS